MSHTAAQALVIVVITMRAPFSRRTAPPRLVMGYLSQGHSIAALENCALPSICSHADELTFWPPPSNVCPPHVLVRRGIIDSPSTHAMSL